MVDFLLRFSLRRRWFVLALAVVMSAVALIRLPQMPIDVLPDLSAPKVTVVTESTGMAPEEIERLITFPIESAVNGVAGLRRVRSASASGISIVWVEFDWSTEDSIARQRVTERLQGQLALPPEADAPILAPPSSVMGEIAFVALQSRGNHGDSLELRRIAEVEVRRQLLAVPGVSQVVALGGLERQYQVIVDPERLHAYQLSVEDLISALREGNKNVPGGYVIDQGQESVLRVLGRADSIEDLENISLALRGGHPVRVKEVATVMLGAAFPRGTASYNGEPAVVLSVVKQPGADTLRITEQVDRVLDQLAPLLEQRSIFIQRDVFRQADFVETAIANLMKVLQDGTMLVVGVLLLFLWSLRPTLISAIALPLSLSLSILVLDVLGLTLDTMTLGGLAIAIGELVDDAIVDVENVVRRLRDRAGLPASERPAILHTVLEASREVRLAIVSATAIIMLVFVPLLFLDGLEGRLLQPLATAYLIAIASSLLVAVTVTPALCSWLLPSMFSARGRKGHAEGNATSKPNPKPESNSEWPSEVGLIVRSNPNRHETPYRDREPPLLRILQKWYRPLLGFALRFPGLVVVASIVVVGLGLFGLSRSGRSFLPEFNEGSLTISAVTLPGTSLEQSDALAKWAEKILLRDPAVVSTLRRTGRAERDEHVQGVEASEIDVRLRPDSRRKDEIFRDIRQGLAEVPGLQVSLGQPISHRIDHMISGQRSALTIKVIGEDLSDMRRTASQIHEAIVDVPGLVDLNIEQAVDIPHLVVRIDATAAAQYGMSKGQAAQAVGTALWGSQAGKIYEHGKMTDVVVRYDEALRYSKDKVARTLIPTPSGAVVPLRALAELRTDQGSNYILREHVQRRVVLTANVAERDLRSVYEEVRSSISNEVELPRGIRIEYAGQFEREEASRSRLMILGSISILGIAVIVLATLGSLRRSIIVLINLPLALAGGVIGVFLGGGVVSVASIIGFITLFGIATRNGILLATRTRDLEREGLERIEAVRQSSQERLAPILMTAVTAGLGLLPLALALGQPGSEIQAPMALVILTGLATSTTLNMIVVPALLAKWGGVRKSEPWGSLEGRG